MVEVPAEAYPINPHIFIPTLGKDVYVTHEGVWRYAAYIDKFWREVLAGRCASHLTGPVLLNYRHPLAAARPFPSNLAQAGSSDCIRFLGKSLLQSLRVTRRPMFAQILTGRARPLLPFHLNSLVRTRRHPLVLLTIRAVPHTHHHPSPHR